MKGLGEYICPVSDKHKDIRDRISALFLNQELKEFDVDD